jgi:hypothetical protein
MTYPSGRYRRRIRITAGGRSQLQSGDVVAELEDDFHHFRVTVAHDGARVTGVRGMGVRFPWSTCPFAAAQLEPLVGMPLSTRSTAVGDVVSARDNCTHMFDLAGLAVAHAARGGDRREYDVVVADPVDGRRQATVERDGEPLLAWLVDRHTILDPAPFKGQVLRGGFLAWAEAALDPDTAEAAIVLRRACHIAHGRAQDLDVYDDAGPLLPIMSGACFTFQPERAPVALRMKGTIRDFSDAPGRLLEAHP